MISSGEEAPTFSLPAIDDGDIREVALEEFLGDDIVILAFYPADFNPACDGETTGLDEFDLFAMQKDVSILGISGDSVYSHREFAKRYDLHIPLLADVDGEVASAYGVAVGNTSSGYGTTRAVVVIGPGGDVEYAWQAESLTRLPPVDEMRRAIESVGSEDTAMARYRVGHAHYVEARRSFTSAMGEFEGSEWLLAQGDFGRAREEFDEATEQFNTAARFAVDDETSTRFERAEDKADALSQAAEWLNRAASAYASGEGAEGDRLRSDAEGPLETARDIAEPPEIGNVTADVHTVDGESDGKRREQTPPADENQADDHGSEAADREKTTAATRSDDGNIDESEIEAIAAEVEAQNRRVESEDGDDQTEGESDDEEDAASANDDVGDGNHDVSDSL